MKKPMEKIIELTYKTENRITEKQEKIRNGEICTEEILEVCDEAKAAFLKTVEYLREYCKDSGMDSEIFDKTVKEMLGKYM